MQRGLMHRPVFLKILCGFKHDTPQVLESDHILSLLDEEGVGLAFIRGEVVELDATEIGVAGSSLGVGSSHRVEAAAAGQLWCRDTGGPSGVGRTASTCFGRFGMLAGSTSADPSSFSASGNGVDKLNLCGGATAGNFRRPSADGRMRL